jgi:hypothetical protein
MDRSFTADLAASGSMSIFTRGGFAVERDWRRRHADDLLRGSIGLPLVFVVGSAQAMVSLKRAAKRRRTVRPGSQRRRKIGGAALRASRLP